MLERKQELYPRSLEYAVAIPVWGLSVFESYRWGCTGTKSNMLQSPCGDYLCLNSAPTPRTRPEPPACCNPRVGIICIGSEGYFSTHDVDEHLLQSPVGDYLCSNGVVDHG